MNRYIGAVTILAGLLSIAPSAWADSAKKAHPDAAEVEKKGKKVLWEQPSDIAGRDLISGQGGAALVPPTQTYEFVKEDLNGTNPKFSVRDSAGGKWKLKVGDEARPETVATRLVWAVGFHTDEDYFFPAVHVTGIPEHVNRGRRFIDTNGTVHGARLERDIESEKKLGTWSWSDGPFAGSRELNGLRVMMALINNWDLKDENNTVYEVRKKGEKDATDATPTLLYVVSDLGATFGPTGFDMGRKTDKGEFAKYSKTKFIRRVHNDEVDFSVPGPPSLFMLFKPAEYFRRRRLIGIGRNIPEADAKWMGTLLSQLTGGQIRDAFRAGGYSTEESDSFAVVVQRRISALAAL